MWPSLCGWMPLPEKRRVARFVLGEDRDARALGVVEAHRLGDAGLRIGRGLDLDAVAGDLFAEGAKILAGGELEADGGATGVLAGLQHDRMRIDLAAQVDRAVAWST